MDGFSNWLIRAAQPVWSRTTSELFFMTANRMMVVEYQIADGAFVACKPRVWASVSSVGNTGFSSCDLAPDGKRFAIFMRPQAPSPPNRRA